MVLRASRSNDRRMGAIGFPTYRYRLVAFAISGTICGIAGALDVDRTEFLTPLAMGWNISGEIMIFVIMGGMGTILGPVLGTTAFLLMENYLKDLTEHWYVFFGPFLILILGGGLIFYYYRKVLKAVPEKGSPAKGKKGKKSS